MNLASLSEADLAITLEDSENGFGWPITLIDGAENEYPVTGKPSDIGFFIDPQSGEGVQGRRAEITVRIKTLTDLGGGFPDKSWKAQSTDTNGNTWNYTVERNRPDRTLGVYNIFLLIEDVS